MLSVASAIVFLWFAVGVDDRQAVHQAFHVLHAQPAADERQALPVQRTVAVCQQVEHAEGDVVALFGPGWVLALILDARL